MFLSLPARYGNVTALLPNNRSVDVSFFDGGSSIEAVAHNDYTVRPVASAAATAPACTWSVTTNPHSRFYYHY